MYNLGVTYENGDLGLTQSITKANEMYALAAEKGHAAARYNLGWNYENGIGVEIDFNTATVAITLINQNDSPSLSTYLPRLDLSIGENSAIGNSAWTTGASTTTTYCATDQDVSDQLIFSIISGNDAGTFEHYKNPFFFINLPCTLTLTVKYHYLQ